MVNSLRPLLAFVVEPFPAMVNHGLEAGGPADELAVPHEAAGQRLDVFLAQRFPQRSREQLRRAIQAGAVQVDGRPVKAAYRLRGGERVAVRLPAAPPEGPQPEPMELDVLYEDEHVAAVNKPPGVVVHPSKGHWRGTLAAGLAWRFQQLSGVGGPARPGIVHRLDRDTSGVLLVAKTDEAHGALAAQFESRTVRKEYFAITAGAPDRDRDVVVQPIGAHPHQREKMAIRQAHRTSRPAETMYEVAERFPGYAALRVFPKTGRTHQIRVHLAHLGCPVLCDRLYGGRSRITRGELGGRGGPEEVVLARQALHARRLELAHPISGRPLVLEAPVPEDLQRVLRLLRRLSGPAAG